jgi:hypothetical protein
MKIQKKHRQLTSVGFYHFRHHCVLRILITDAEEIFKENTSVPPAVLPYEDSMHFTHTVYFILFMILRINSHYFPTPYSV